jgi:hypothetical protein
MRRHEVACPAAARSRASTSARELVTLVTLVMHAAACVLPDADMALAAPCAARAKGQVEIGTGADAFAELSGSVDVAIGPQNGGHVWFALRCRNLGPRVEVSLGVRDLATGMSLSEPGLRVTEDLVYDPEAGADEIAGLHGYLNDFFEVPGPDGPGAPGGTTLGVLELGGREIALWAKSRTRAARASPPRSARWSAGTRIRRVSPRDRGAFAAAARA